MWYILQLINWHNNFPPIELLYCGIQLKDDKTLESHGIVPGVTIHVLKKPAPDCAVEKPGKKNHCQILIF